jgi:fumarate reductase subunit C
MATAYPRQRSSTWFLRRWSYRLFVLRELSATFLAGYVVVLLILVAQVHDGPASFRNFEHTLKSPGLLLFNSVAMLFALLHSVTWFQAVPKALPIRRGEHRVPPQLPIWAHFILMFVLSAAVLVIALV